MPHTAKGCARSCSQPALLGLAHSHLVCCQATEALGNTITSAAQKLRTLNVEGLARDANATVHAFLDKVTPLWGKVAAFVDFLR